MPELPEVETVRRGLEPAICDKRIADIKVHRRDLRVPVCSDFEIQLRGAVVKNTQRRGKYIVVTTVCGTGFVLHLGMSGRISIFAPGQIYEPQKHDHIVLSMEDKTRIVFSDPRRFGMMYVVEAKSWQNSVPFCAMGPEPLENDFNGPVLHTALKNKKTSIKAALLDQRVVAGIGNIYACEALYETGISPEKKACDISPAQCEMLCRAIRAVLERAIASGGSSLKDYKKTDGSMGYFQHSFAVYDRAGQPCPECDCDILKSGGINRIVQSGRSTFYCARRQT